MGRIAKLFHRGSLAFKRRYVARGLILIYHRVAEDPVAPWRLCVSPDNFALHMEILRKKGFKTVHVSALADAVRARNLPRKTVAVSFDDGDRDNLDAARPILEKYDTPAAHFATAGYIGSDAPFWWVNGTICFYFAGMACNIFFKYLVKDVTSDVSHSARYIVFSILNVILYACWSYSFICRYFQRTSTS